MYISARAALSRSSLKLDHFGHNFFFKAWFPRTSTSDISTGKCYTALEFCFKTREEKKNCVQISRSRTDRSEITHSAAVAAHSRQAIWCRNFPNCQAGARHTHTRLRISSPPRGSERMKWSFEKFSSSKCDPTRDSERRTRWKRTFFSLLNKKIFFFSLRNFYFAIQPELVGQSFPRTHYHKLQLALSIYT